MAEILVRNTNEYIIFGITTKDYSSLLKKKIKKETVMFLARHGKQLYFTDNADDKCIFKLNTETEAKKLVKKRLNDIIVETKHNHIDHKNLRVGYFSIINSRIFPEAKEYSENEYPWKIELDETIDELIDEAISDEFGYANDRITNKGAEFLEKEATALIKHKLKDIYEDNPDFDLTNEIKQILTDVIYEYELDNGLLRVREEDDW